jgi:hypothetical protein
MFFIAVVLSFRCLWLSDIIPALLQDRTPVVLEEVGLPVNPVHVLDLAFFLPAMACVSILLWRKKALGFVLAVINLYLLSSFLRQVDFCNVPPDR